MFNVMDATNYIEIRIANILSHDFLTKDIQIGMDIDEFHMLLPRPDLSSNSRRPYFEVFDGVHFVFHHCKLVSIHMRIQEVAAITSPNALVLADLENYVNLNLDQWLEVLRRNKLKFRTEEYADNDRDLNIYTQPQRLALHYDKLKGCVDLLTVHWIKP